MNTYGLDAFSLGQIANSGVNLSNPEGSSLSAYPTYPNGAGVGSQTAGAAPVQSSIQQANSPAYATTGFNPWSMVGEANARTDQK